MLKFIFFILVLLVSNIFGELKITKYDTVAHRILGGREAQRGQFPYQANLRLVNNIPFCSAIVIHNQWVLSAAHCLQGSASIPANIRVVVGTIERTRSGIIYAAVTIVNHPSYNEFTFENDISLIRTQKPMQFNDYVKAIALPTQDLPQFGQVPSIISGWGNTHYPITPGHPQAYPEILHFKRTTTISNDECKKRHGNNARLIHPSSLCTINPIQRGICQGDAGGPLVRWQESANSFELIGIAAWYLPCGRGIPDVYVRVYPFLSWIRKFIK